LPFFVPGSPCTPDIILFENRDEKKLNMNKIYHNRLSGAETETPNDLPIFGIWQLHTNNVSLNTVAVVEKDFLVPDHNGQWLLVDHDTAQRQQGSFAKHQLLSKQNDILANSIKTFQPLLADKTNWDEWLTVSPLMPNVDNEIAPQPLDKQIIKYLNYLEEVCQTPRTHLEMDTERVPVSRARRLSPKSANYLAAHTEDWEYRTISSVYPKRILSQVNSENWNIYENRVAARLIDKLNQRLHHRISEIRRCQNTFDEINQYFQKQVECSYLLRERISTLWGNAEQVNESNRLAKKTLKTLEALYHRIMALKDSDLYREIPHRAQVADRLKMTNIFTNDDNYRHVALLWRECVKTEANQSLSAKQSYQNYQQLCQSFDNFCGLLMTHALKQLKFVPNAPYSLQKGCQLQLVQPQEGTIMLTWAQDGTFTLTQQNKIILHIVPIPAMLATAPPQQYLDNLLAAAANGTVPTLILYPAPSTDNQRLDKRLCTIGNEGFTKLGMLPVSPFDIHSTESVARAMRWVLTSKRFLNYPPKINLTTLDTLDWQPNASWLKILPTQLQVLRLPDADEAAQFNLENTINELTQSYNEKQQQRQQISHQDNHRLRARLNQALTELAEKIEKRTRLKSEMAELERLLKCPLCGEQIDAYHGFQTRTENLLNTFWCECPNCKAQWGTQRCTLCHQVYPILLPNLENLNKPSETIGWVDKHLGCDVLTIPNFPFEGKFLCPECGHLT